MLNQHSVNLNIFKMAKSASNKNNRPEEIKDDVVTFWHMGRAGFLVYETGKEPLTGKPIEKMVKFVNHIYNTSNQEEIKILDEVCERSPNVMKRFSEYELLKSSKPEYLAMEINGKKVKVPISALEDSYKKEIEKELEGNENVKTVTGAGITKDS